MTDEFEFANSDEQPSTLSEQPRSKFTMDMLGGTASILVKSGVPDAEIAETLFELAKAYTTPNDLSAPNSVFEWYTRLVRFRDQLDEHIQLIDEVVDCDYGTPH